MKGVCRMDTREDLRTEHEAMLAAGRELSQDTDRYLAERFLDRLGTKTVQTTRRRRRPTRKPHRPGRTATALLVAGLALAIGTPISLHANQNNAPIREAMVAARPYSCSWHARLVYFQSLKDLRTFRAQASPKFYRFYPDSTRGSGGEVTIRAAAWECP